ncbi:MAG: MATE family efflux transporter, partial [Halobacteriota archaeon]
MTPGPDKEVEAPPPAGPRGGNDRAVDVVNGQLFKPMLILAAPIVAGQLLQVGYNLADTYWVGRLGGDPVAALSYSWAIIFLMVSVGGGLTVAGTVMVAQYKGAEDFRTTDHVAGQTLSFVTVVALGFAAVGFVLTPYLISLVGATPGTPPYRMAVNYTRIIFAGVAFMFWFFIFDALSRGWGDTRTPLYLMAISITINVVADPFLILGFADNPVFAWVGMTGVEATLFDATGFTGFGVEGAAVATLLARGVAAVAGLYLLFNGQVGLQPHLGDLWLDWETVRSIVDIGGPIAIEQGARAGGLAMLTAIIALAGDDAVAAYGIVNRLSTLLFLPALGLSRG